MHEALVLTPPAAQIEVRLLWQVVRYRLPSEFDTLQVACHSVRGSG